MSDLTTTPATTAEEEVRAVIQAYVDGCSSANAEQVAALFTEGALMWGFLGPTYASRTGTDFAQNVIGTIDPAGPDYASDIHSIEVTGDIARAALDERGFLNANFRNNFGLLRQDGVWRITSKVFTTVSSTS